MTPALTLYLLAAARAEALMRRRPVQPGPESGGMPAGQRTVWIHLSSGQPPNAVAMLAARLFDERPETEIILTCDDPEPPDCGCIVVPRPADLPRAVGEFLDRWRPSACVWIGGPIWPVLAAKTRQAGVPIVLANAGAGLATGYRGVPARELLGLASRILPASVPDGQSLSRALRRQIEGAGRLQRSAPPLDHDERELARLGEAIQARPTWYAAGATMTEIDTIDAAHRIGLGASHRLLLIVEPAGPEAKTALLQRYGACRSAQHAPQTDNPVFVADVPDEKGMWYRLASVSFIGGTIGGPAATMDPYEAASLGSALIHGPRVAPFPQQFAELDAAMATRRVTDTAGLGQAVADLLAPDRAATLAQRGWEVVSDGAETTDRVVETVIQWLEGAS